MNYQKEPILEPTTQAFADSTRSAWQTLYTLSYSEARQILEGAQAREVGKLPADIEDKILPVGPTVAVIAQLAKERGGPSIRYQVLFYPVTDASLSQRS